MSQATDLPLQETPQPTMAPPRDPLVIVIAGLLSLVFWLAVGVQIVFVAPRLEKLFADFKVKLPWLTEQVLHESRWAVPAITIAALLVCVVFGKRSRWAWPLLLILLPLIINVIVGVGLYFPYMELLEGLNGGNKK